MTSTGNGSIKPRMAYSNPQTALAAVGGLSIFKLWLQIFGIWMNAFLHKIGCPKCLKCWTSQWDLHMPVSSVTVSHVWEPVGKLGGFFKTQITFASVHTVQINVHRYISISYLNIQHWLLIWRTTANLSIGRNVEVFKKRRWEALHLTLVWHTIEQRALRNWEI